MKCIFRKNVGIDRVTVQKVAEQKTHVVNTTQQVRQRKKRRILPQVLQGLMGEANLRFAKGEVDIAVKMCMEIIRQVHSIYRISNIFDWIFRFLEIIAWNGIFYLQFFDVSLLFV